jgi:hypothetical protein
LARRATDLEVPRFFFSPLGLTSPGSGGPSLMRLHVCFAKRRHAAASAGFRVKVAALWATRRTRIQAPAACWSGPGPGPGGGVGSGSGGVAARAVTVDRRAPVAISQLRTQLKLSADSLQTKFDCAVSLTRGSSPQCASYFPRLLGLRSAHARCCVGCTSLRSFTRLGFSSSSLQWPRPTLGGLCLQ